jgi:hypothetical protein
LSTDAVIAFVRTETQLQIGLDSIQALLLQFVGPELIGQADTSSR